MVVVVTVAVVAVVVAAAVVAMDGSGYKREKKRFGFAGTNLTKIARGV